MLHGYHLPNESAAITRATVGACLAVVFSFAQASAIEITLDSTFPGRGWFNDVGFHISTNDNTFTGTVNPNPYSGSGRGLNSFYVYDLSPLAGLWVTEIRLRFVQDMYFSSDPSETIEVYDVSTAGSALIQDYPRDSAAGIVIHDDLETGAVYGGFTAIPGNGVEYNTMLGPQALTDMNNAIPTGEFSIGLHNATDSKIREDGTRFDFSPVPDGGGGADAGIALARGADRVHQLIVTAVPIVSVSQSSWGSVKARYK
jgi:hypothetical protein